MFHQNQNSLHRLLLHQGMSHRDSTTGNMGNPSDHHHSSSLNDNGRFHLENQVLVQSVRCIRRDGQDLARRRNRQYRCNPSHLLLVRKNSHLNDIHLFVIAPKSVDGIAVH